MRPKAGLYKLLTIGGMILLGLAACGGAATPGSPPASTPTATEPATATAPPATPTATPGQPPAATPTPRPVREWDLVGSRVEGSTVTVTVTVLVRPFAGADVQVTLDGSPPREVARSAVNLRFVFREVAAGSHELHVADVVGYEVTGLIIVPPTTLDIPEWLGQIIRDFESGKAGAPPDFIGRYQYQGETVYYVAPRCCDIFSDVYDEAGNLIAHPDGGITGQGDGRAPGFRPVKNPENVIWENTGGFSAGPVLSQVAAPVESVEVLVLESFPPQYRLNVVSGLPNACFSFSGYYLDRQDDAIDIKVLNWEPPDSDQGCAEIYRTVETSISLGAEFQDGRSYTVKVNDVTEVFVAQ